MLNWLLYTMLVGGLLTLAAHCVGRVCHLLAYPTRWVWVSALTLTVVLAGVAPYRARVLARARSTHRVAPRIGPAMQQQALPSTSRLSESMQFVQREMTSPLQETITVPAQRVPISLDAYLAVVWGTSSVVILLFFATVYLRFRRARRGWPISDLHGVRVRIAPDGGPVVIGILHPEIVIPQWLLGRSAEEQRVVLTHEQEHIRAGDPWVLAVACVMAALLPWHPLVWWMVSRLRLAIELDCDTRVLRQGVAPRAYGALLIDLAERCSGLPVRALALADNRSHLKQRLLAMRSLRPRFAVTQGVFLGSSALFLFVTACIAQVPARTERMVDSEDDSRKQWTHTAIQSIEHTTPFDTLLRARQQPTQVRVPEAPALQRTVPLPVTEPSIDSVNRVVAVVGDSTITWNDLMTQVNQSRAQGLQLPPDTAGQLRVLRQTLSDLVDQEILLQQATLLNLDAKKEDIVVQVDWRMKQARAEFSSDEEYRSELKKKGFGTPDEYRRSLLDQLRRTMLQQKAFVQLLKTTKPGRVTEADVDTAYERVRTDLQKRPATISFRQIAVAPRPSPHADSVALAKAKSLLVQLHNGANFAELAKRESMDLESAKLGGELGWQRRGSGFIPEFEAAMFALSPGQVSPPVKTVFGYHLILVDGVRPAAVHVRHILIAPVIDSNDVHEALLRADAAAQQWRHGMSFDSLVSKYHDPREEKGILQPYPIDSLPVSYRAAITNMQAGQVTEPFPLKAQNGTVKYAVLQIITRTAPGEYSLSDVRVTIREQLEQEKQARQMLDDLRRQTHLSLRL